MPAGGFNLAWSDSATIGMGDGEILVSLKPNHHPTPEYVRALREDLRASFPQVTFFFLAADISTQTLNFAQGDFLMFGGMLAFTIFGALALTGLRPGELCHLLLPDDLDLGAGRLRVRNKPWLGWQVKTRSERDVPLAPALAAVLADHLGARASGPVFRRRGWDSRASALAAAPGQWQVSLACKPDLHAPDNAYSGGVLLGCLDARGQVVERLTLADVFGTNSSLHRTFKDARLFYSISAALIAGAAAIVLIPGAPLGVITRHSATLRRRRRRSSASRRSCRRRLAIIAIMISSET